MCVIIEREETPAPLQAARGMAQRIGGSPCKTIVPYAGSAVHQFSAIVFTAAGCFPHQRIRLPRVGVSTVRGSARIDANRNVGVLLLRSAFGLKLRERTSVGSGELGSTRTGLLTSRTSGRTSLPPAFRGNSITAPFQKVWKFVTHATRTILRAISPTVAV